MRRLGAVPVGAALLSLALSTSAAHAAQPNLDLLADANIRIDGQAINDTAGYSVAAAGDVNDDGRDDVIVGARDADNNGRNGSGSAYVVYGSAAPASVDLAALGASGFRIDGADVIDHAGTSVAAAGDVNDDGRDDVIVGAPGSDINNTRTNAGTAYVVYGSNAPANVDLAALGAAGFRIDGAAVTDNAGISVAAAGDVNDDGRDDVIVGAFFADNNGRTDSGSAYVVYGSAAPANVDLAALGAAGFRIDGQAATYEAGNSVAGAGDVNGDGRDDVIVGAFLADNNGRNASGSAYVVYGSAAPANVDLAALGAAGFRIDGQASVDTAGNSVAPAGDVNDDGRDDVIVGAPLADNNGRTDAGSAYVVYGSAAPANVDLAALGAAGFRIDGAAMGDEAGYSVAAAGDVNDDGRDDVIVGARQADNNGRTTSGSAYVVYGSNSPANVDLAALGASGFRIDGAAAGDQAGFSVAAAGDFNDDGRDDVIVGAFLADNNGRFDSGSVYVITGDSDSDGVRDDADNCRRAANASQADNDGDANPGGDLDGGDACDPDDDNDTVADAVPDNCPTTANTDQANNDGDAQGDICDGDDDNDNVNDGADNCPTVVNTGQANNDGDGQGDACDSDDDNDTVADGADNCPANANTGQANTDGDAAGDVCDADDDNDSVNDGPDNCPTANTDQANNDGDAQGDACDADDDNDSVNDGADNCPATGNADQANNDGDGQGDACDPDDDGDAEPDVSDLCPTSAAQTSNGCPKVERSLTLRYQGGAFRGTLEATQPACEQGQSVELMRRVPGPDRSLGQALSSAAGDFTLRAPDRPGRYYALVRRATIPDVGNCARARDNLTLR